MAQQIAPQTLGHQTVEEPPPTGTQQTPRRQALTGHRRGQGPTLGQQPSPAGLVVGPDHRRRHVVGSRFPAQVIEQAAGLLIQPGSAVHPQGPLQVLDLLGADRPPEALHRQDPQLALVAGPGDGRRMLDLISRNREPGCIVGPAVMTAGPTDQMFIDLGGPGQGGGSLAGRQLLTGHLDPQVGPLLGQLWPLLDRRTADRWHGLIDTQRGQGGTTQG